MNQTDNDIQFIVEKAKVCNKLQYTKLAAILKHNQATLCANNSYIMVNLHATPPIALQQAKLFLESIQIDTTLSSEYPDISLSTEPTTHRRPGVLKKIHGH